MPQPSLFIANAAHLFDGTGRMTDEATIGVLKDLLLAFDDWIARAGLTTRAA
jgi:hypothetical protein